MQKEGFVSLFIGNMSSSEELDQYVLIEYTEDGDAIPSSSKRTLA